MEQISDSANSADWGVKFVFNWEIVIPWPLALLSIICLVVFIQNCRSGKNYVPDIPGRALLIMAGAVKLIRLARRTFKDCLGDLTKVIDKVDKKSDRR